MQFHVDIRPDHLFVEVSGPFTSASARALVDQLGTALRGAAANRVLIDARGLAQPVSISDRFDIGAYFASLQLPVRVAVVVGEEQMFTKTLEHPVVHRGAPFRTTTNLDEARQFLGL